MDPRRNPYSPGAGLRPTELAGRDDDIESFEILIDRAEAGRPARSIIFTGLRGVGKTVLLQDLAGRAEQRGWITARVEADRGSGPTSFTDGLARSLATSLRREQGRGKTKERLRAALRTVTSFSMSFNPDGAMSLGFDVDAATGRADSGSLYADLTDLALDLGDAAVELDVGVAVFIDEMQDLTTEELSAVCRACHETGQRSSPWFVIGCGLPNLPGALATAESYAERLFDYRIVGRLPHAAAHSALVGPATIENVEWAAGRRGTRRRPIRRVSVLHPAVRSVDLERRSRITDHAGRCRTRREGRVPAPRQGLLPCPMESRNSCRAGVPLRDGGRR